MRYSTYRLLYGKHQNIDTSIDEVPVIHSKVVLWGGMIVLGFISFSCSTTSFREVYPLLSDGKYDSEFPYRGCSEQLERIAESVRMISCIAYYKSYIFPLEAKLRIADIQNPFFREKAVREVFLNRSSSGSATVVSYGYNRIALLTCAHVVNFNDTIITYYYNPDGRPTGFIQNVAVKERQTNYVGAVPGARDLEILTLDKEKDLAIVGQRLDTHIMPPNIIAFNYPIGKAKELEWGAFVYLFGYPAGYRVVTKGIVSNPNRDKNGSFLTDAVFSRGFSGGIMLAIRDGVPNFELVGMATLVPAHQEFFLTPVKEGEFIDFDQGAPYKGDVYIDSRTDIIYGVAPAIPSEVIVDFITDNLDKLYDKGYDLHPFIERQPVENKGSR
jgi:hypothetical protein